MTGGCDGSAPAIAMEPLILSSTYPWENWGDPGSTWNTTQPTVLASDTTMVEVESCISIPLSNSATVRHGTGFQVAPNPMGEGSARIISDQPMKRRTSSI
jgi:hypothetical protein